MTKPNGSSGGTSGPQPDGGVFGETDGGGAALGETGEGGVATGNSPTERCAGIGKAAAPTAACCPGYGVDACGAGLVCAALDGRTQSVCYLEKSIPAGAECTSDKLCSTGLCDLEQRKCKKAFRATCKRSDECGLLDSDPAHPQQMVCMLQTQSLYETPGCNSYDVSDPVYQEACVTDSDCGKGRTGPRIKCTDSTPTGYRFCK